VTTFIVGKVKGTTFEVLEYDKVSHRAVLRAEDGTVYVDHNFVPYMVKRVFDIRTTSEN